MCGLTIRFCRHPLNRYWWEYAICLPSVYINFAVNFAFSLKFPVYTFFCFQPGPCSRNMILLGCPLGQLVIEPK